MTIQENKVTLYIATHNKTGLKYFGKTTKYFTQYELQKHYHGGGGDWKEHLKEFGNEVTMEIYGIYDLKENSSNYVVPMALEFSRENNIVLSNDWTNRMLENGLDGSSTGLRPRT